MDINIENNNLNLTPTDQGIEVETNKENVELDLNNSRIQVETQVATIYEKDHKNLENLDYESSGHTGFQKAGDYALKSEIPNVSNFATKNEILTKTSELENDSNFITNDIKTDFNIDGKLYLNTVKSGVGDTSASRIVFGTPDKTYSYLSSNNSGAFAFSKGSGNITIYPKTGTYNCIMSDCDSDLGRSDRMWKDLYLSGNLKDGTNTIPISNIATKKDLDEVLGDIEALLGGI